MIFWEAITRETNERARKTNKNRFNSTHFKSKDMCTALKAWKRGNGVMEARREWEWEWVWGRFLNTGQIVNYSFRFVIFAERHAGVKASLWIYFRLFLCVCVLFLYLAAATILFWTCSPIFFSSHPNCEVDLLQVLVSFFLLSSGTWHASKHIDMEEWTLFKHVILDTNELNWTTTTMVTMLQLQVHMQYEFHSVNYFNVFFFLIFFCVGLCAM